ERIRKDIESRYEHLPVDVYRLAMPEPAVGPELVRTSDDLETILANIKPFILRPEAEHRRQAAEKLRNAAERFCKHVLVRDRRDRGDTTAMIGDYDGRGELGKLIGDVSPLLKNEADRGKLRSINQNTSPGKHDDSTPSRGDLDVALGD